MVDDCEVIVLPLQELKNAAAGVDSADALLDVQEGEDGICPLHSTRMAASVSLLMTHQAPQGLAECIAAHALRQRILGSACK